MPERICHSCAFTALASGWSWTPCGIAFTAGHQLFEVTAMRFTTQWVRLRSRAAPGRCAPIAVPRYLVSTPMDGVWSLDRVWLCCPAIDGPGGVAARSRDTR